MKVAEVQGQVARYSLIPDRDRTDGQTRCQWLHIQKIGYVRLTGDNPYPDGIAKSGTVKEENGKWYAYIVYAVEAGESLTADDAVGIDRNVGQIALSDGTIYRAPDVEKKERRKKRYQRMMARRQKPVRKKGIKASGRYQKARPTGRSDIAENQAYQ